MKNKYYQPKIEEFCVGFEYEYQEKDGWKKTEIFESSFTSGSTGLNEYIDNDFNFICENIDCGNIRVKHLDREDIESENWAFEKVIYEDDNGNDLFSDGFIFRQDSEHWFELVFIDKTTVFIQKKWYKNSVSQMCRTVFYGTILNKSRLKLVMVMLNIEKK